MERSGKQNMAKRVIMDGKYKLRKKIGSGSFGVIHAGILITLTSSIAVNLENGEQVAIKMVLIKINEFRSQQRQSIPSF